MDENKRGVSKIPTSFIKYIAYSLPITLVIFGVMMYAKTIEDEHISGAFALFPVFVVLTIFFARIIFEFFRASKSK